MAGSRPVRRPAPRPLGVVLLALVQIWNGLLCLLVSPVFLAKSSKAEELGDERLSGFAFLAAFVYLVVGIYSIWLARGYVKGYEWARRRGIRIAVFAIVFMFVGIIFAKLAFLVPGSPFWTIVGNIIIILYLGEEKVKRFFASRTAALRR